MTNQLSRETGERRHPMLKRFGLALGKIMLIAFALGFYGRWQYRRGFEVGADTAICAFASQMQGESAFKEYEACRNITDRSYEIDGFDPRGNIR